MSKFALCWRRKRGARIEAPLGSCSDQRRALQLAKTCVSLIPGIKVDKGSGSFRAFLRSPGLKPVTPGGFNRKWNFRYGKKAYEKRNPVERCLCRREDFRRIATGGAKLARNFFSALCLVATFAYLFGFEP